MTKISDPINDLVHLEVDASDILNQVANHSAQTGNTSGWTADTGITLAAVTNPVRLRDNLCTYDPDFEATTYTGVGSAGVTIAKDTSWFNYGSRSIKITPQAGNNGSAAYPTAGLGTAASIDRLGIGVISSGGSGPGIAFTISATIRLSAAQTSTNLNTLARRIVVGIKDSTGTDNLDFARSAQAPNTPGIYRLSVTFTVKTSDQNVCVRLFNGSDLVSDVVWWDSLLVESGTTTGVWSETLAGTYTGGKAIRATYASSTTTSSGVLSPAFTVAPGQKIGVQYSVADSQSFATATSGHLQPRTSVLYYDTGGNAVGTTVTYIGQDATLNNPWRMGVATERSINTPADQTVPAGAATARLKIRFADRDLLTNGINPIARAVYLSKVMIVLGATADDVKSIPFTDAAVWQNVAGSSIGVHITRGGDVDGVTDGIDAGMTTATVLDAAVDPNLNPRIRPGRKMRVTAASPTGDGTFLPLFTGSITEVGVNYDDSKTKPDARPRVTLTGTDAVADLRGVAAPYNYSGTFAQKVKALMALTTVVYSADAGTASATKSSLNESASLWDQLLLARNSYANAKVWLDAAGVLQAHTGTAPYGAATLAFSDTAGLSFTDIATSFGSKNLVNSLIVNRTNADEADGSKAYGPYLHGASVVAWKTTSAEIDVIDGVPADIATALLQRYGVPTVFPTSLTFSALDSTAWSAAAAFCDIYSQVGITYTRAGISTTAFVLGIEHDITAFDWTVTLTFRPTDATTTATITNGSGTMTAGPRDVVAPTPGPYAWRTQSTQTSYASATWTSTELDTNQVADGSITYDTTNRRFSVPRAGRYQVNYAVTWNPATAGRRLLRVVVNGDTGNPVVQATHPAPSGASGVNNLITMSVSKVLKLAAGDTITPQVYQDSGAALVVYVNPMSFTYAEITYLGQ